ncbi:MAG TPA: glucose 1-dehydrogenase [Pinirhizobacter sp.]|uniref:SDR family NAD(P)-dependent oxidoreductase n=1 Tax=Pinirhizobacter sp. TaxID=2950432 RepID=UPI002CC6A64D|nr:glucose 1-dehydrogenase [Pinirhizobacter sp.]HMH67561.1 glucose 1-dehydrogenase [Pinirhizobacter sp.]
MQRLIGKVAVITGGSKGIGAACAKRMVEHGARVCIADIDDVHGEALAKVLGSSAIYVHADVTAEANAVDVMAKTTAAFGGVDVLVNNAGITGANKPTDELSEAEWDLVQAVNVKGVFLFTKHVIDRMRERGGGSIINLSSIYGLVGAPDIPAYHASKGAVRLMSKTDALLFADDGIRVNSIHPGFIWTPLVEDFIRSGTGDEDEERRILDGRHPLGHMGDPDDIAWGVVYLASDEARFITGSELVIDGGYTCR